MTTRLLFFRAFSQLKRPEKACWNCGHSMNKSEIFCPFMPCNKIQPTLGKKEYFDVLYPNTSAATTTTTDKSHYKIQFNVDEKLLKRRFFELQQKCHPDSFAGAQEASKAETEKKLAEEQSSWLNKAYSTLKDPLHRAQYILEILDSPIEEDSKTVSKAEQDADTHDDHNDILLEVMDAREEILEAESNEKIREVKEHNRTRVLETIKEIESLFPSTGIVADIKKLRALTIRLKYLYSIDTACKERLATKQKRAASAKGNASTPSVGADSGASGDAQAQIKQLQEELKKEKLERNYHLMEKDKILGYWDITKKQLDELKFQLEKKDRENEEMEERHREEVKSYKQKVKHLLFEYQTNLTRVEADANKHVDLAQEEHVQEEDLLKKKIRALKIELKELELSHQEVIKNLKLSHNDETLKLSTEFDLRCKELFQKYANKAKTLREELETKRKTEIHEVEERKNMQINSLIKSHEKSFAEMKNYYNDITLNNLALINTLKEQLEEVKKAEEKSERMMNEISIENKKLKEPLEAAIAEGDQLKRQLKNYGQDKMALKHTKARLKEMEEKNKDLTWELDVLSQRFTLVNNEKNDILNQFTAKCKEIEQKIGLKNMILEKKIMGMETTLKSKDVQLWNIAKDIANDPKRISDDQLVVAAGTKAEIVIRNKEKTIQNLYRELIKAVSAYNGALRAVEDQFEKYHIRAHEWSFQPMQVPKMWSSDEILVKNGGNE